MVQNGRIYSNNTKLINKVTEHTAVGPWKNSFQLRRWRRRSSSGSTPSCTHKHQVTRLAYYHNGKHCGQSVSTTRKIKGHPLLQTLRKLGSCYGCCSGKLMSWGFSQLIVVVLNRSFHSLCVVAGIRWTSTNVLFFFLSILTLDLHASAVLNW